MSEPVGLDAKHKEADAVFVRSLKNLGKFLLAILLFMVLRTCLFHPLSIPSGWMLPNLLVGDNILVSKYAYGYSRFSLPFSSNVFSGRIFATEPKRGDVAAFKLPRGGSTIYLERVIGLPGDRIQMVKGRLVINGETVEREPVQKFTVSDLAGRETQVPTYLETLPGGVSHLIIERDGDEGFYDSTNLYEVPPGHYFMMADNRDNATDSRIPWEKRGLGYVPFENFIGRAEVIYFSLDWRASAWEVWKWPTSMRWSKLFQIVR